MAGAKLTDQDMSIVLIGSFNPKIFHPDWLLRYGLIPTVDADGAEVEIVHNELSRFSLAWLDIEVTHDRFIARTHDPAQFLPLRDLIASAFKILEHTPATSLGINSNMHFSLGDDVEGWHKIGDTLAPKEIWNESLPERVGLATLAVQSPRQDNLDGKLLVSVKPSRKHDADEYGIFINVNSHVDLSDRGIAEVPAIITEYFEPAIDIATTIANTTINSAMN